jgi:tetratricopeptide (TPR) repeat protein
MNNFELSPDEDASDELPVSPEIRQVVEGDGNQVIIENNGTAIGKVENYIETQNLTTAAPVQQSPFMLPPDIGDFTGRSQQILAIEAILKPSGSGVAISAVDGMPGIGKSALAIHVAHRLKDLFPEAQLYANLQGASDQPRRPEDVLQDWLLNLGYVDSQIPLGLEEKAALYRNRMRQKRALVLLDNAADTVQVKHLLPGDASCVVMITSRRRLATLANVQALRLEVMDEGEALDLLKTVAQQDWAGGDLDLAKAVVKLCGYLPLAIRIAGALLRKNVRWTIGMLLEKLRVEAGRLEKLNLDDLNVRSSFNVSFGQLGEAQQGLLVRLSGLVGQDFGLLLATQVSGLEREVLEEALDELLASQLLEFNQDRYGFHDLVRLFGREKLGGSAAMEVAAESVAWYRRAVDYWDDCVRPEQSQRIAAQLEGPGDLKERVQGLVNGAIVGYCAERKNLLAALNWAYEQEDWETVHCLFRDLQHLHSLRGHRNDSLEIADLALEAIEQNVALEPQQKAERRANTLKAIGDVLQFKDRRDEALENYKQAIAIYGEVGARLGEANTLKAIGDVLQFKKRSDEALENYKQAIAIYGEVGARLGEANTLQAIGIHFSQGGDYRQAVPSVEKSLSIYREIGDRYSQANALQNLAFLYQQTGRIKEGFTCGQEANQIFTDLGLLLYAMPKWIQSIVKFSKKTKMHLVVCVLAGIFAFPFAITALIMITVSRFILGRFRR